MRRGDEDGKEDAHKRPVPPLGRGHARISPDKDFCTVTTSLSMLPITGVRLGLGLRG